MRLCLIPAKAASTRLIKKNLIKLGPHSLLGHTILKAVKSELFDNISVSTESEEVAREAHQYGAEVPFLRPKSLSVDPATLVDVISHALSIIQTDTKIIQSVTVVLPTTPLISISDIRNAYEIYEKSGGMTVMSVTAHSHPVFNAWMIDKHNAHKNLTPCFPDSPFKYTKSTECPETYRANGGITIIKAVDFTRNGTYRKTPILPYIMPEKRSVDIDTEHDLALAEFFFRIGEHDWLDEKVNKLR